eukprot:gb/GECH01013076.1/.p1 GENE.gb/GECH01013076.1/~~gb/GECH01013076.1/.p1  ORF type:complete len:431 (+),score=76.08 gb/GECH01013076.1/:1-1293(+)
MISIILMFNSRGVLLMSRTYRDNIEPRTVANAFKTQVIMSKQSDRSPVHRVEDVNYLHVSVNEIFFVAATKQNINAAATFEFLHRLAGIFRNYFQGKLNEQLIRENYSLVHELLDEVLDYGYAQNTEASILKTYIKTKGLQDNFKASEVKNIVDGVTGKVMRPPDLKYRRNEVFIDVIERVNMLMSHNGEVLDSDVYGRIMMKTFLSGIPECKFGLNDASMMRDSGGGNRRGRKVRQVHIDNFNFHPCVRLNKFDSDRTIAFVPPDGEFELANYRIQDSIKPPFRLISPIVTERSSTRIEVQLTIKSQFSARLFGKNVQVLVPLPHNTAKVKANTAIGSAKYKPEEGGLLWKIKKFPGHSEYMLSAEVRLMSTTVKKAWNRPPISLKFQVPMYTASALHVRFLKVYERSNYETIKWVRYVTEAGNFETRI